MPNTISVAFNNPVFTLEKDDVRNYLMSFTQDDSKITIQLPQSTFEAFVHQGQVLLPSQERTLPDVEQENAFRMTAWIIKQLDDRSLQLLLRELQSDTLIILLWYLKDRDFAKTVMRNMSTSAAEMLTDDLINRFQGRNPDTDRMGDAGRFELNEALSILHRLADEGQIETEIPR